MSRRMSISNRISSGSCSREAARDIAFFDGGCRGVATCQGLRANSLTYAVIAIGNTR
jgi:hypothetical protein